MKYKLGHKHDCAPWYRVVALRDFGDVKAGDVGGWVQSESNLSHDGDCWVYDNAKVLDEAVVKDNATVYGEACVCNTAKVLGNSKVGGRAQVSCNGYVGGNAIVYDNAWVSYNGKLEGAAVACGRDQVFDEALTSGRTKRKSETCLSSHLSQLAAEFEKEPDTTGEWI